MSNEVKIALYVVGFSMLAQFLLGMLLAPRAGSQGP